MTVAEKEPNPQDIESTSEKGAQKLAQFFNGRHILITGATGFVGKALLVKLMTSFANCGKVYILMRPKKGLSIKQRFNKLLDEDIFADAQIDGQPVDWSRVEVIEGNMCAKDLGLSDEDRELICKNVSVFVNVAASVTFDAPIKQNLRDNFTGPQNALKLATEIENLVSFIHCSTFYTNCHETHIREEVKPLQQDCERIAGLIASMPDSMSDAVTSHMMEKRPNTYVFTKAMAENLVMRYEGKLPVAIVRPSIVLPAARDPQPGWVDNVNGPMGLGVLASLGILRNVDWNYWGVADMIPVDYVANTLLAAAERTARLGKGEIKVYNCSSSKLNPVTWGEMFGTLRKESLRAPPYKMLRVPIETPRHRRANKLGFAMSKLSELLFAYFIDMILVLCGQKRLLTRLTAKLHHGYDILRPFTIKEHTCDNDNLVAAFQELDADDKLQFDFQVEKIQWAAFFHEAYMGTRRRLLKEDDSTIPAAVIKMRVLMAFEMVVKGLFYLLLGWTLYNVCGRFMLHTSPASQMQVSLS